MELSSATIVLCSFENPWARAGGLFAVVREYASYIKFELNRPVVIISPCHWLGREKGRLLSQQQVWFGDAQHDFELRVASENPNSANSLEWHLIDSAEFFNAQGGSSGNSPYSYAAESVHPDRSRILRDSLFFSVALPDALRAMGLGSNLIVHLQDWQTAPAVVAIDDAMADGRLENVSTILTIHNPYDHGLTERTWQLLTKRDMPPDSVQTVYRRILPLLKTPPTTVSREFARDLVSDSLQTLYFADHLQDVLAKTSIVGVDNGPFEKATEWNSIDLLVQKAQLRHRMLTALAYYEDDRIVGRLEGQVGHSIETLADDIPFFMMSGRLDPRQKGFDILVQAIRQFFRAGHDGRFLIAADASDAPASFLHGLEQIADMFVGRVMVCAFRMQQGYLEAQAGCTFSVWPSFYEPFGGVSEFFLKGTPVVARATGGLRQQVVDIDTDPEAANGIVYHTATCQSRAEWKAIMDAAHPNERIHETVYQDNVDQLSKALAKASDIYRKHPDQYRQLLSNCVHAGQDYSWSRVWDEYSQQYQAAIAVENSRAKG